MFFQIRALPAWGSWILHMGFYCIQLSFGFEVLAVLFVFSKFLKWSIKPGFRLPLSLVTGKISRMGHAQSGQTNTAGRKKYLSLCSHLKFKYFNFCEVFSQRSQSDFFLESRGHFTRIKKLFTKWATHGFVGPERR